MKRFITRFLKSKKAIFTTFAVTALAISGSAVFAGWGMDRPAYDWNKTADQVGSLNGPVFNSFINTPVYGDERAFLDSKDAANTTGGGFADETQVQDGKEYLVRMYIHNDANENTNASGVGVAKDTKVRFKVLSDLGNSNGITGYISASNDVDKNGNPVNGELWDTTELKNASQAFQLSYVPGSAQIYNNSFPQGKQLPDDIVNGGVLVGNDQMDGNYKGCFNFQAYVNIKVRVNTPQLKITKEVRKTGTTEWKESVDAKPGETVQWLIEVTNAGKNMQHNVKTSDLLPPHVEYVPGTAKWYNSDSSNVAYDFDKLEISDGDGGYNFGNYAANGGNYLVRFDTKVLGDFDTCKMSVRNIAYASSDENTQMIKDTADVTITKENCNPPVTPTYTCDLLDVAKGDNRTATISKFKTHATNAAFTKATVDWGDGKTQEAGDIVGLNHTYAQDGTYKITATAHFNVNGQDKTATSADCAKTVTFTTPGTPVTPVYTCNLLDVTTATGRVVTVSKFDTTAANGASFANVVLDWGDNTTPLTTNNAIDQKHTYAQDGTYKITATAHFNVNGQDKTATSADCAKTVTFTTPVPQVLSTTTTLPNTGMGTTGIIVASIAATILGTIGHAVIRSRRIAKLY